MKTIPTLLLNYSLYLKATSKLPLTVDTDGHVKDKSCKGTQTEKHRVLLLCKFIQYEEA